MCGIFGFALKKHIPLARVLNVLEKLEAHQYPSEPKPVGGYGAGVAILDDDRSIVLEKVGKVDVSPARRLSEIVKIDEASVLMGHVRMPSPEFIGTAKAKATAQPYVAECISGLTVVSVHNGKVENYEEIRRKLANRHLLESEQVGLIDSEVVPHFFEEKLQNRAGSDALSAFFEDLSGSNAIGLLQVEKEGALLHLVHKGKTRGLTVWTNDRGEVVFCSRKEPLMAEFKSVLAEDRFEEKVSVPWNVEKSLKLSFAVEM
jgi:glucosamine 6-phosphate synthetase-like amidotransferase/phosphosugar isomerase protein